MTRSFFLKFVIGVGVVLMAAAYQIERLRKFEPSLEDFRQTTSVSGVYSYERYGKNVVTRIDGKLLHCGVTYGGGNGSCFVPLMDVPRNSRITVAEASIKTSYGDVSYVTSIIVDGYEIYTKSPKQSLHDWWLGSCFEVSLLPLTFLALYIFFLIALNRMRG